MSSLDEVKDLLDGTLDPESLDDNPELYEMAESIYGREVLEQMGVEAPERPTETIVQPNGDAKHEVQMPTLPLLRSKKYLLPLNQEGGYCSYFPQLLFL